ncbi:MAG: YbbR-like domain-containing protein [Bacteroidota bacterium]
MKRTYREIVKLIKNYSKGRNYRVFFVFVFISTLFWLLIKLSKSYTVTDDFSVKYISVPENLSWSKIDEANLSLEVSGSGFQMLNYTLTGKKIEVDLSELKKYSDGQYYVLPEEQFILIKQQFPGSVGLSYNGPDTIHFDFSKKVSKKIPVILNYSLDLDKSYKFLEPVSIKPDSITISGPSSVVTEIDSIETVYFERKNLRESTKSTIAFKSLEDDRVELSVKAVSVEIKIEQFTQNRINVPVAFENIPQGFLLKTFPDNVELIFNAGLSDCESIKPTHFEVVADYDSLKSDDAATIPLKVNVLSDKVDLIRVEPAEVEFLLRKIDK